MSNYSNSEYIGLAGHAVAKLHGSPTPAATQKVTFTATAASSGVLPSGAYVMLTATQPCFIRFSPNANSAVVDIDMYLVANVPYLLSLGYNNQYVSVVQSTTGGALYITPMAAD
jgi:hypothetical protein